MGRCRRYARTSGSARRSSGSSSTSRSSIEGQPIDRDRSRCPRSNRPKRTATDTDDRRSRNRLDRDRSEGRRVIDPIRNYLVPTVVEQTNRGERAFDLYSRCSRSTSSSSARRSTTRSPTSSAPSCCTSSRRTPTRTSTSTSTRPAATSPRCSRSTTRCSTSSPTSPRSASARRRRPRRCCSPPARKGKRLALPHARVLLHQPYGRRGRPGHRHRDRGQGDPAHARPPRGDPGPPHRPAESRRSTRTPTATS